MQLPKHTQRRIYWNKDGKSGVACVLIGYCPDNLLYFNKMFTLARKTFPSLRQDDCICGKVTRSSTIQGFTLLMFTIRRKKTDIRDWDNYEPVDFNY